MCDRLEENGGAKDKKLITLKKGRRKKTGKQKADMKDSDAGKFHISREEQGQVIIRFSIQPMRMDGQKEAKANVTGISQAG